MVEWAEKMVKLQQMLDEELMVLMVKHLMQEHLLPPKPSDPGQIWDDLQDQCQRAAGEHLQCKLVLEEFHQAWRHLKVEEEH